MVIILSILSLFSYAVLIINFIKGWSLLPEYQIEKEYNSFPVAIITACKNEREHLPYLFQAINEQTYRNFQFILVDDDSTDGCWEYAGEVQLGFPKLKLLKNNGKGKKEAIKTAVEQTDAHLIITLDADCYPKKEWLETIVGFYSEEFTDLVICPVKMSSDKSFLQDFQQFDFVSLVASGAGAAGIGMPVLCNGANLAFRRQAWTNSMNELHFEEPSGDDIFLLQSIKRQKGAIRFLKSKAATVETTPQKSLKAFFNQRKRWAGKKAAYADRQLTLIAVIVFLASLAILFSLFFAILNPRFLFLNSFLFLMKWVIDFSFFQKIKDFFDLKKIGINSFLFSFIYPFYIVFTAVSSLFFKNKRATW